MLCTWSCVVLCFGCIICTRPTSLQPANHYIWGVISIPTSVDVTCTAQEDALGGHTFLEIWKNSLLGQVVIGLTAQHLSRQ